jgi:hypothetical protein
MLGMLPFIGTSAMGQRPLHPADVATDSGGSLGAAPSVHDALPRNTLGRMRAYFGHHKDTVPINQAGSEAFSPKVNAGMSAVMTDGSIRSDATAPDLLAHEMGHVDKQFQTPQALYDLPKLVDGLAIGAGLVDPRHAIQYGLAGSAAHLPQLWEEGRASVKGWRALNAATAHLPDAERRSLMARSALRMGTAGLTYGMNAAVPTAAGWLIDRYANPDNFDENGNRKG